MNDEMLGLVTGGGSAGTGREYIDAERCVNCGSCAGICPVKCIAEDEDRVSFVILPGRCIRCRVCLNVCPTRALVIP